MSARDDHELLVQASERLIRDADAPERVREDARGFFAEMGLSSEHAEAWSQAGPKRLLLYRKLVRDGVRSALRKLLPCTAARLGAAFDGWVDRYCQEQMPRSHYLRDVADEFVKWVLPQWSSDSTIPRYLPDLARWEVFDFQVTIAESIPRQVSANELGLDKPVVFDSSVRLAFFDYAVHRLGDDETNRDEPAEESVWVFAYRDAEYEVQCLELNPFAAGILERLLAGETLGAAVTRAFGGVPPASALETVAQMLADLAERKALLGAG